MAKSRKSTTAKPTATNKKNNGANSNTKPVRKSNVITLKVEVEELKAALVTANGVINEKNSELENWETKYNSFRKKMNDKVRVLENENKNLTHQNEKLTQTCEHMNEKLRASDKRFSDQITNKDAQILFKDKYITKLKNTSFFKRLFGMWPKEEYPTNEKEGTGR